MLECSADVLHYVYFLVNLRLRLPENGKKKSNHDNILHQTLQFSFSNGSGKIAAVHFQTVRYLIKHFTIKKQNMLNEKNTKSIRIFG